MNVKEFINWYKPTSIPDEQVRTHGIDRAVLANNGYRKGDEKYIYFYELDNNKGPWKCEEQITEYLQTDPIPAMSGGQRRANGIPSPLLKREGYEWRLPYEGEEHHNVKGWAWRLDPQVVIRYTKNPCCEIGIADGAGTLNLAPYTGELGTLNGITFYNGEDNMPKKTDLYEIKIDGETKYGNYLATNSDGLYVFEIKGTGDYVAVPKDEAERVMPYTVDISFLGSTNTYNNASTKVYAYLSEKGKVSKGDLLIVNNGLAQVMAVDTKSELATKELTGYKLQTETI